MNSIGIDCENGFSTMLYLLCIVKYGLEEYRDQHRTVIIAKCETITRTEKAELCIFTLHNNGVEQHHMELTDQEASDLLNQEDNRLMSLV